MSEKKQCVTVFTAVNLKGDSAVLDEGDFSFDTKIDKTISAVSHSKTYKVPIKVNQTNFKNNAIKSLQIAPFIKVTVYETTSKGGRNIEFINNSEDTMIVNDLSTSQYDFSDKISHISVESIKNRYGKTIQETIVTDAENMNDGTSSESFRSIDTPEERQLKIFIIVVLLISSVICFAMGLGIGKSWRESISWNSDANW